MIPLKLSLKNFLCYRDDVPPLDFSGIHVACLCGPNGHGKSALLDAITWALWGEARGKTQDDLLHFGQDEMWVELEFLARDTKYRVVRRHSRGGLRGRRGASNLELQVSSGDGFHPITGNTMRETQAKVQQIIGMDYDTFINSAFLIQGRADEFTNKSPGERKEVLGKIIGLGRYDEFQERSRHEAQEKERRADDIEATFQFMRGEIARKEDYQQDLNRVTEDLRVVSESLVVKGHEAEALRLQVQTLEQKAQETLGLEARIPQIEVEIGHFREESHRSTSRIEEYRGLVNAKTSIEEGFQRYEEVRKQYDHLNTARTQYDTLNRQVTDLRQTIAQAKTRLEEQANALKRRLEQELEPRSQRAEGLEGQLAQARVDSETLAQEEEALTRERTRLQELASRIGQLVAIQGPLKTEGEELRAKLDLLNGSHQDARCPLCDTPLGEEGCRSLSESYRVQIEEKRQQYRENLAALKETEEQKAGLDRQVPEKETALRQRQQQAQRQAVTLERDLEESHRAAVEVQKVTTDLKGLEHEMAEALYAPQEQASLKDLELKLANLGYSPERHRELSTKVQELQTYQLQHQQLGEALQRLPQEEEALTRAKEMEARRRQELLQTQERLTLLKSETADLPARRRELETAEGEQRTLQANQQNLLARRGDLEGSLQRIEDLQRQMAQRTRELTALREDQGIYQELSQAFSRQGLQALLIETILPRIEEEANQLLARMTDGRMNVKLETQRELKSRRGEYAETLEIRISDELGPRSYEMFSGGEAFRINLALRIALSKVLAHRSGAPLPTLFIDEGFGTQDTAGRERILDVIRAIEPDFEQIIVITHLEELKEAFPVRIEVEKKDGASTCWIS
ncbi:MAG: AAA family ATPase [Dehalococcoidia bacterium]